MTQGFFMEALMDFSVAIKLDRDRKENEQKNQDQGVPSFERQKKDSLPEYFRNAGQANYELAQFTEALQHFDSAIRGAGSGHDYFNRGLTYMKLGDYTSALEDFKKALAEY